MDASEIHTEGKPFTNRESGTPHNCFLFHEKIASVNREENYFTFSKILNGKNGRSTGNST